MKDSKFIELLNLYLDQQIEPAEAALLEEEIARHPARRQTYQQYCRMHRACTLMFEQAQPESEQHVILGHRVLLASRLASGSVGERADAPAMAGASG